MILVTGGAGFLGINLICYLVACSYAVVSLDIAPFDYPDPRAQITVTTGDIRDEAAVTMAMEGVDLVVHAAAALPLYPPREIYTTDVDGTRTVFETVAKDSFVAIDEAQRQLGWQPRYSNREALLRNFEWYIVNRDLFKGEAGISHRAPWKQGALGLLKRFC